MIELLLRAAGGHPEQAAVISPRGVTTYADLVDDALRVAAQLSQREILRFGVLEPDPARVIALLAGSAAVAAEACVYPLAATDDVASAMCADFDHQVVATERPLAAPTLGYCDLTGPGDATPLAPQTVPDSGRLMVLTTGTSGHARGVCHEWSRVLRASRAIRPASDQRWLLAYGLNQFGGLQILLHVLAAQATLVAAEGFAPRDGLAAMREWGVTHVSGTPTFWRFVLSEMRADGEPAPPLRQVTLGGEAVPSALLAQLREAFPQAKISQIYGATEFGRNITVRDGLPGLPVSVLDDRGDLEFKVMDAELWVRSRTSMLGYYQEEPVDVDQWRATGDLVEVVGDRIEFRGRKTDVINVGGIKVHPLPVEERASLVPGVDLVRAFGRPNPLSGSIVAVEIVAAPGYDERSVADAVRAACADLPAAARPRSIRFVATLHTTGNKMSRGVR